MSYSYSSGSSNTSSSSSSSNTSSTNTSSSTTTTTTTDTSSSDSYSTGTTTTTTNTVVPATSTTTANTVSYNTASSVTTPASSYSAAAAAATTPTAAAPEVDSTLFPDNAEIGDRFIINSAVYELTTTGWVMISDGSFLRFPSNPEPKQRYSIGNKTWEFDGEKWALVYVGAVEDQDDYVKRTQVEHLEYFGVTDSDVTTPHDLYGQEIDQILYMLNHGPSVYSIGGSPLTVNTQRDTQQGDSTGMSGTNFQVVNLGIDLRTITSVAEIDIKDIIIRGKESPIILEPTTYTAELSGRPVLVGYSWNIRKPSADGTLVNVPPSEARFISPSNRSYVETLFREMGNYTLECRAQVQRKDSIGNIVIDNEIAATLEVVAGDSLPADNMSPPARTVTNFHDPDKAETPQGYTFYKMESVFLNEDGTNPASPVMNFRYKTNHGLHFIFSGLADAQADNSNTQYTGFMMVHEDLMNDRLKVEQFTDPDGNPFNIADYDNFLIGPPNAGYNSGNINRGKIKGSSYIMYDPGAAPAHYGIAAYNYRGLSILDPFRNENVAVELVQADNVSVNSYSGTLSDPLQYIDVTQAIATLTDDETKAQEPSSEITINEFGSVTFSNAVLANRFTRGYLQSVTEVIENTPTTTIHFFKDPSSKYYITNARATKPNNFTQLWIYDLWIREEFFMSLAGSSKFEDGDIINPPLPNYVPST